MTNNVHGVILVHVSLDILTMSANMFRRRKACTMRGHETLAQMEEVGTHTSLDMTSPGSLRVLAPPHLQGDVSGEALAGRCAEGHVLQKRAGRVPGGNRAAIGGGNPMWTAHPCLNGFAVVPPATACFFSLGQCRHVADPGILSGLIEPEGGNGAQNKIGKNV